MSTRADRLEAVDTSHAAATLTSGTSWSRRRITLVTDPTLMLSAGVYSMPLLTLSNLLTLLNAACTVATGICSDESERTKP